MSEPTGEQGKMDDKKGELNVAEGRLKEAEGKLKEAEEKLEKAKGELKEAKGELEKAEGKLEKAKGELKEAKGELEKAEGKLEKARASGIQADIDDAVKAKERAGSELDVAEDGLKTAQEGVRTAQSRITSLVQTINEMEKQQRTPPKEPRSKRRKFGKQRLFNTEISALPLGWVEREAGEWFIEGFVEVLERFGSGVAVFQGQAIPFPASVLLLGCPAIYIRKEVAELAKALFDRDRTKDGYAILTGSPGIGKSVLAFIMALWKAKSGVDVLFIRKEGKVKKSDTCHAYYWNESGLLRHLAGPVSGVGPSLVRHVTDHNGDGSTLKAYVVMDGFNEDFCRPIGEYLSLVTSSVGWLEREGVSPYAAEREAIYSLSAWSKEQLLDAYIRTKLILKGEDLTSHEKLFPGHDDKDRVLAKYARSGGSVRWFFSSNETVERYVRALIDSQGTRHHAFDWTKVLKAASDAPGYIDSIRRLHIEGGWSGPELPKPRRKRIHKCDSDLLNNAIFEKLGPSNAFKLYHDSCAPVRDLHPVLRGVYFEKAIFFSVREHSLKVLNASENNQRQRFKKLDIPNVACEYLGGRTAEIILSLEQRKPLVGDNMIWFPTLFNLETVDCGFIFGDRFYVIQITVGKTHKVDWDVVKKYRKCFKTLFPRRKSARFFFMVLVENKESARSFRFQGEVGKKIKSEQILYAYPEGLWGSSGKG